MMGIGFPELMIILVIIMIIFGAGKLPEIGAAFGNSIKNFKKSMKEAEESDEEPKLEENATASLESPDNVGAVPESAEETENAVPELFLDKILWDLHEEKLVSNVLVMNEGTQYKITRSGIIYVQDKSSDSNAIISIYRNLGNV